MSSVRAIKLYAALDASDVQRIGEEAKRQNIRLVAHSTVFPAKPSDLVTARRGHPARLFGFDSAAPAPREHLP